MPADFDTIVNLAKKRGFVFQSSEVYGGLRSAYDYGPLGVELLRNVKEQWWHAMVRSRGDVEACRQGLADGTLDAIATDHAPHAMHEKEQEFTKAPPGILGLETALPVTLDLVRREELEGDFQFHFGNAWEEKDGTICFDYCVSPDASFASEGGMALMRGDYDRSSEVPTNHMAVRISPDGKTSRDLIGTDAEFEVQAGWRLPLAVEFKASAFVDYNWQTTFVPGTMFARLQYSHTGDTVNQLRSNITAGAANPQHLTPSYEILDFRLGLMADAEWQVDFFINNLTDERAQYTRASGFFELPFSSVQDGRTGVDRIYTNRPREFGIRFSKNWSN